MCHDLECGSGRVHGLVLGVSGSAEMTESAFGVLELSGEAKTPGEGWGGGRRLRQGICRTWVACFSIIAKIRIVGTAFGSNRSCIA